MRVVHGINDLRIGGAQRLVSSLVASPSKAFEHCVVVLRNVEGGFQSIVQHAGVEVHALLPVWSPSSRRAATAIARADVIHVHLFPSLYLHCLLPKAKVFTEHSTWNRRRAKASFRKVESAVYRRYGAIACISESTRDSLVDWLGPWVADNTVVIENGVDLDESSPKPSGCVGREIGMVGSFAPQKDHDCLLRALALLPTEYRLRLAGSGPGEGLTRTRAKQLGVQDRVWFAGPVQDVDGFLDEVDVYVQSSHWEGFGLAAVEAMAKGIPTLGTDIPGLAQVIGDEEYLVPQHDARSLAEKIRTLCENVATYASAQDYVRSRAPRFSIERTRLQYEELYQRAIG